MGGPQQYLEVESKFAVDAATALPELSAIKGVARVLRSTRQQLSATYFDTKDLRLTREKITLRRRVGGSDDGWHIKLPGEQGRIELRVGLDAGEHVPAELATQVRAIVRDAPLEPIAQVDNHRTEVLLGNTAGEPVAEFCDDSVKARSLLDASTPTEWREWELELADALAGTEAGTVLLHEATEVLLAAGAKRASSPSKLLTALGDFIHTAPLPPHLAGPELAEDDVLAPILHRMRAQRDVVVHGDRAVRGDASGALRQMFSAITELRAMLATFAPVFGKKDPLVRALREGLGEASRVLEEAHNAEMVHARFLGLVADNASGVIDAATEATLRAAMVPAYLGTHEDVITMLNSERYLDLLEKLDTFLGKAPRSKKAHAEGMNKLVKKARKKLKKRHRDPACSPQQVFDAVERLRYAALGVQGHQPGLSYFSETAALCHSLLGTYLDAGRSRDQLLRLAQQATARGEASFAYGVCYEREAATAQHALARCQEAIEQLLRAARALY